MSNQKLSELHKSAAKHHGQAAKYNAEAAKYYETGDHEKAGHQAHLADAHDKMARMDIIEASKIHVEDALQQAVK